MAEEKICVPEVFGPDASQEAVITASAFLSRYTELSASLSTMESSIGEDDLSMIFNGLPEEMQKTITDLFAERRRAFLTLRKLVRYSFPLLTVTSRPSADKLQFFIKDLNDDTSNRVLAIITTSPKRR